MRNSAVTRRFVRPVARPASLVLLALMALSAVPGVASAWNGFGHSTIDLVTYRRLSPETRAKLDEILRAHPRYKQDLLRDMPAGANEAEYAFMVAGTWPDIVRDRENPMHVLYHKGNWHYTTVPYHPEGGEEKYRSEPSRPEKPGDPYDSISAYEYNLRRLNDVLVPMPERAVALTWVLHLGGDIHQPCHNVSLYSPRFPEGDRGANLWMFADGERRTNLHAVWDGWLGYQTSLEQINARAQELTTKFPAQQMAEELKVTDVRQWVQEGRFLGIKHVYLDGKLQGISRAELDANPNLPVPQVSEEYKAQALPVALRQAALSAYRLTDALNALSLPLPPAPPATVPTPR